MTTALKEGCGIVVQMDADLSHPAETIPAMMALLIDEEADAAIGSRYAPGGRLQADWPFRRRLLSRAANAYVSLLRMEISDATAGFVAWCAAVLERIGLETIDSQGYAFQVEMKWRARRLGPGVTEVPITFSERAAGSSKMSLQVKLEGLRLPWRLLLSVRKSMRA